MIRSEDVVLNSVARRGNVKVTLRKDMKDLCHSGDGTKLPPAEMRKAECNADLWYEKDISVLDMLNFRYLSNI